MPRIAQPADLLGVIRDLGCLQLDPTSAVARSHLLVLWSRLGDFDRSLLSALQWDERSLFEYWAHAASIVLTEDYQLFLPQMRQFADPTTNRGRIHREWITTNRPLRDHILRRLRREGPLRSQDFEDVSVERWASSGWTNDRNVGRMLHMLWGSGVITVAGRAGSNRLWDLATRWLPEWTPRKALSRREVVRRAAERSIRALGIGTRRHIEQHFLRGWYPGLDPILSELERTGRVVRVRLGDAPDGRPWFVHADHMALLDDLVAGRWEPRTTLLSPFDNLIIDRQRAEDLFGFRFRIEIYTPKAKRQYGYFVMPIVHGDRLIGRVDPVVDRGRGRLVVNAVHVEDNASPDGATGRVVADAIEDLAAFTGASAVEYAGPVPDRWRRALRSS
jgi:uncharacterized protein